MFRSCIALATRRTPILLGGHRFAKNSHPKVEKEKPAAIPSAEEVIAAAEEAISKEILEENAAATHILPQKVLVSLLDTMITGQKSFLLGADSKGKGHETFFDVINASYQERMMREKEVEVKAYADKRAALYDKRLEEETEEFRRERRAIHEQLKRVEVEKYKEELINDVRDFTVKRQQEFELRLRQDTNMYHKALLSHSSKSEKKQKYDALVKSLDMDINAAANELDTVANILDFGLDDKGNGNDITDDDIRNYITKRLHFYEHALREELQQYSQRRVRFYEDLVQARSIRHAAKVRLDTNLFREKRAAYYSNKTEEDAKWMGKAYTAHYNNCFLQTYAREAWLSHRSETVSSAAGAKAEGDNAKQFDDLSSITATALNEKLPLDKLFGIYEKETISDVSRDAFLAAARRIAKEGPIEPVKEPVAPVVEPTPESSDVAEEEEDADDESYDDVMDEDEEYDEEDH